MTRKHLTHDEMMAVIIEYARRGERCPLANSTTFPSKIVGELARTGRIRVDVYAHNWRRITITEPGQHFGQATAPPPNPNWKPYLTIQG